VLAELLFNLLWSQAAFRPDFLEHQIPPNRIVDLHQLAIVVLLLLASESAVFVSRAEVQMSNLSVRETGYCLKRDAFVDQFGNNLGVGQSFPASLFTAPTNGATSFPSAQLIASPHCLGLSLKICLVASKVMPGSQRFKSR